MFGFVGFVLLVVGGIHLYLWKRLIRDTMRAGPWRKAAGGVILLLAILIPATMVLTSDGNLRWLAWPGYLWLALIFYLLVALVIGEVPRLVIGLIWRANRRTEAEPVPAASPPDPWREDVHARAAVGDGATTRGPAGGPGAVIPITETTGRDGDRRLSANGDESDTATARGQTGDRRADQGGMDRRLLLARGAAIFAGLTAAGITGYGVRTAAGGPRLDRAQIPIAKLPRALDGTRLAVVSDIHLGPLTGANHLPRIVSMINSTDADVVCIVGDMVDGTVEELGARVTVLRDIHARRGAYFVTGNHEYYSGFQQWADEVARLGVRPLRNERLEIATGRGAFDLAGVNDVGGIQFGEPPDFDRALGDRDTSRPVVLMAHQPVMARDAARYGVDLQVSGHTHGGQMVPFTLIAQLQQPVVSGYGEVDGVPVYVTNGAGFWGPPVRVGAPPQVTLIELRAP